MHFFEYLSKLKHTHTFMLKKTNAWLWIPTLYFASGLPYHAITSISDIMYKDMGISNSDIALYTSLLGIPWTIKPLWSPFVEMIGTRRKWTLTSQLMLVLCFAIIALTIPTNSFLTLTLIAFMIGAFVSSTHDIALDGFYILALPQDKQSFFSGIRNTFYRIATVFSSGVLVMLAGTLGNHYGSNSLGWSATFATTAIIMLVLFLYHSKAMPKPDNDTNRSTGSIKEAFGNFGDIVSTYFSKPGIWAALLFLLLFRFPEAQLGKMGKLFLMDGLPVPAKYEEAHRFSEGYAVVKSNGKYGYINEKGEEIVTPCFDRAASFSNDTAEVLLKGKEFYICKNITGRRNTTQQSNCNASASVSAMEVPRSVAEEYDSAGYFINGYAVVKSGQKYGLIDTDGRKAIPLKFDYIGDTQEKMIPIMNNGKYGFATASYGLCLDKNDIGLINGIIGILGLIAGGILGGICISRKGLKYWLWPMVVAISLPDIVYVYMSMVLPDSLTIVGSCIFIEQLGYGFGFTAYTLYMIYFAQGKYPTAHFAMSTAFMSLGMMLPGILSGYIQEWLGYGNFFIWVMACTAVTFAVSALIKINPNFGKK